MFPFGKFTENFQYSFQKLCVVVVVVVVDIKRQWGKRHCIVIHRVQYKTTRQNFLWKGSMIFPPRTDGQFWFPTLKII